MKKILLVIGCVVLATGCATNEPSAQTPVVDAANTKSSATGGGQPSSLPTLPTEIPEQSLSNKEDILDDRNLDIDTPVYKAKPKFKAKSVAKVKYPKLQTTTKTKLETQLATHKVTSEKSSKSAHKTSAKPKATVLTTSKKTGKLIHKATSKLKSKPATHKTASKKSGKPEHKATSKHAKKH